MRKGFIFNHALCVNCKSCCAACTLENRFTVEARTIVSFNSKASISIPLENISIACNHCEIPVCLYSCPALAYSRDPVSGAILIDQKKCIGCRYCIWNCPYDAPKYDVENRVIGKCHLCYSRLSEGLNPSCTDGCPTGALRFGIIDDLDGSNKPGWFPVNELDPSIRFTGRFTDIPLRIVPSELFRTEIKNENEKIKYIGSEWSLVLFSFLLMLSVSVLCTSFIKGVIPDKELIVFLTLIPGFISFFHLGRGLRAWRSVINVKKSPLSREILFYLIYMLLCSLSIIYDIPFLLVVASIAGLLLLLMIDSVYIYSDKNPRVYLHSGQIFITSLLIISYLSGSIISFIFIAIIKLILSVNVFRMSMRHDSKSVIRYLRIAFLIITGAVCISGIPRPETFLILLLLTGEFMDRILFYVDFEPNGFSILNK